MPNLKDVMNAKVVSIREDEDIYEAIRTMVFHDITGLPVVRADDTLAGVITEKDVLALLYNMTDKPGMVRDFMTAAVVCFHEEDDLTDVVEALRTNQFRRVPILDRDGRLVGIISRSDIIRYIRGFEHEAGYRETVCSNRSSEANHHV